MALDPSFADAPNIGGCTLTTANNVYDGTGTVGTAFTADATSGSVVGQISVKPLGTNVATVLRLWANNGGSNATASNNFLLTELTLPATTASANAALINLTFALNIGLMPGWKINCALGTTVAAGWQIVAQGADL